MSETKRCTTCGETKSLDAFYRDRTKPDGLRGVCKPCTYTRVERPPREIDVNAFLRAWTQLTGYACVGNHPKTLDDAIELARHSVECAEPTTLKEKLKGRRLRERLDETISEAIELAKVNDESTGAKMFYAWHKYSRDHARYSEVDEKFPFLDHWEIWKRKQHEVSYERYARSLAMSD